MTIFYRLASIYLLLLSGVPQLAFADEEESNSDILAEMKAIRVKVTRLENDVKALQAKVDELDQQKMNMTTRVVPRQNVFKLLQGNRWNASDCGYYLHIYMPKMLKVTHIGESNGYRIVRAEIGLIENVGIFYFEVNITTNTGSIGIGFATKSAPLNEWLGENVGSYGYTSNGYIFGFGGRISQYGWKFGDGDVVGWGMDLASREIIVTKNGVRLNTTGLHIFSSADVLYPAVHLQTPGDTVAANFGPKFVQNLSNLDK